MSDLRIHLCDPRARVILNATELGTLRPIMTGDRRGPELALLIAKPKGGTSRTWKEVRRG